MAKSIASRIEDIRRAVQAQTAGETVVAVDLVCCESRAEALALLALPATPPPAGQGAVRLQPRHVTAADYLADRGITLPQPETT